MKEGSGGTPRKFFEDMPSTFALNTSANPMFAGVYFKFLTILSNRNSCLYFQIDFADKSIHQFEYLDGYH